MRHPATVTATAPSTSQAGREPIGCLIGHRREASIFDRFTVIDPFDVVRALCRAVNQSDLDAVCRLYDEHCVIERPWPGAADEVRGRDGARAFWMQVFQQSAGALPGGARIEATRIAGMESGWGWVRAEWRRAFTSTTGESVVHDTGYSDFWVEAGLIRRQRNIERPPAIQQRTRAGAEDPALHRRPLVGVGGVVFVEGRVVLVKRRHEPLAGQWSLPGGGLELGETLEAGVAREVLEETGLVVDVGPLVEVFDRILLGEEGQVRFHFVIADYLCTVRAGTLRAGGDVDDAVLVAPDDLGGYGLTEKACEVIARARPMAGLRATAHE